ncbi:hypothetical protein [Roseofilum casamattae]|uniref:Uncharacterized protein n=1 Tax=Roseofilum casamattae BLCC-M143 TaxID=3022442 RepID=A0ABT7C2C6_9CYAN|nr:hypothetical protein [Roseofilum casamattae]MDJ1185607.1 hypothetical protein [Roseofilum casamattae BLCC-M143]
MGSIELKFPNPSRSPDGTFLSVANIEEFYLRSHSSYIRRSAIAGRFQIASTSKLP